MNSLWLSYRVHTTFCYPDLASSRLQQHQEGETSYISEQMSVNNFLKMPFWSCLTCGKFPIAHQWHKVYERQLMNKWNNSHLKGFWVQVDWVFAVLLVRWPLHNGHVSRFWSGGTQHHSRSAESTDWVGRAVWSYHWAPGWAVWSLSCRNDHAAFGWQLQVSWLPTCLHM